MPWAILLRSDSRLDGYREHFAGNGYFGACDAHPCRTKLFETREAARDAIRQRFSDRLQPDLRAEPHGWLPALAVKVVVTIRRAD